MKHLINLGLGLIAITASLIEGATPRTQLTFSCCAIAIGAIGVAVTLFHARQSKQRLLFRIELLLFAIAILFVVRTLIDVGLHWE